MEVILKGKDHKIQKLLHSNSLFMKRNGIEVVLSGEKEGAKDSLTAKEVVELISNCTSINDLKEFESDNRQVVSNAYKKKLKELK